MGLRDKLNVVDGDVKGAVTGRLSRRSLIDMLFNMTIAMIFAIALVWILNHFFPNTVTIKISVILTVILVWALIEGLITEIFFKWRSWRYILTDNAVVIRHGVVFRHEQSIVMSQILSVKISQGPIRALLKLDTLSLETVTGEVDILPLERHQANEIRDWILERISVSTETDKADES